MGFGSTLASLGKTVVGGVSSGFHDVVGFGEDIVDQGSAVAQTTFTSGFGSAPVISAAGGAASQTLQSAGTAVGSSLSGAGEALEGAGEGLSSVLSSPVVLIGGALAVLFLLSESGALSGGSSGGSSGAPAGAAASVSASVPLSELPVSLPVGE